MSEHLRWSAPEGFTLSTSTSSLWRMTASYASSPSVLTRTRAIPSMVLNHPTPAPLCQTSPSGPRCSSSGSERTSGRCPRTTFTATCTNPAPRSSPASTASPSFVTSCSDFKLKVWSSLLVTTAGRRFAGREEPDALKSESYRDGSSLRFSWSRWSPDSWVSAKYHLPNLGESDRHPCQTPECLDILEDTRHSGHPHTY